MAIKCTIATSTTRDSVIVEPADTIRKILNENNVTLGTAVVNLNGTAIAESSLDTSLSGLNVSDNSEIMLAVIVKAVSSK